MSVTKAMKAIMDCANKILADEASRQHEVPTGSIKIWDLPEGYIFKDENGNVINAQKACLAWKNQEFIGVTLYNRWLYTTTGQVIGKQGKRWMIEKINKK